MSARVGTARCLGAVLLSGVLLLAATACGPEAQTVVHPAATPATTTAAPSPTPTPTPTPTPVPVVWPLTGVPATAVPARPALAVKIENSIDARPQTGLDAADLVWEEVVEGGITRYLAVYQSALPPVIGPVRSVRPMDPAIAGPLHGLMAFSGGQQAYVSALGAAGLQLLSNDAGAPGFYRIRSRPAPHNVYADPAKLLAQADAAHAAPPPAQFGFPAAGQQPTAVTAGAPATALHLTLSGASHPQWTWSAPAGRWLRAEGSTPAVGADGKQFGATNVVVLRVDVVITPALDPAGNHVPETVLAGTGAALVASAGHTVAATWSKPSVTAPVALTGPDGAPVLLAPGNTWIELVPNGSGSVTAG